MTIRILQTFDEARFEDWLREGLERYLWEGAGASAFPGADAAIWRSEDLDLGLADAYRQLDARRQGCMRRAVANVLATLTLEPRKRNLPLFEHLLSLAALLPAPEILRVLPGPIGSGFFGRVADAVPDAPNAPANLFGLAMLTAARLAAAREQAVACLHALIGSENFDVAYSGLALEALARADGQELVAHCELLRASLASMFEEFRTDADQRRTIATSVLNAVQLPAVLRSLGELKYLDRNDEFAPLDAWFPIALLAGDLAPLVCERDAEGHLFVFRRDQLTVRGSVPQNGPSFSGLHDLLQEHDLVVRPGISYDMGWRKPPDHKTQGLGLSKEESELAKLFGIAPDKLAQHEPAITPAGQRAT